MASMFAEYAPQTESVRDEHVAIREATPVDVPALVAIDATRGTQRPNHEERVLAQVVDPITYSLVATLGDEVIGWTTAMWWCGHADAPDGYYISGITVLPDHRRKGAGERLLDALLQWVWARNDSAWSIINARNAASITMHERVGFREVGRGSEFAGVTFVGGCGALLHRARPYRVMAVCTGNTCRSPMAEVVLRARLDAAGLGDEVVVDSAGVEAGPASYPIDPRACAALARRGYAVPDRSSRPVHAADLSSRELVLAMTSAHAQSLRGIVGDAAPERIVLLRSFDPGAPADQAARADPRVPAGPRAVPGLSPDVDDPWTRGAAEYDTCLDQIEAAADGVVAHVRSAIMKG